MAQNFKEYFCLVFQFTKPKVPSQSVYMFDIARVIAKVWIKNNFKISNKFETKTSTLIKKLF